MANEKAISITTLTRLSRVPGVTLQGATLDPTKLSAQMRGNIRTMLKTGYMRGLRSHARSVNVAIAMANKFGIPYINDSRYSGLVVPSAVDAVTRMRIADISNAGLAAWLLTQKDKPQNPYYGTAQYVESQKKNWEQEIQNIRLSAPGDEDITLHCPKEKEKAQMASIIMEAQMAPEDAKEHVASAVRALDGDQPIVFEVEHLVGF